MSHKRPDLVAKAAQPRDKEYKVSFGNGLFLHITPKGRKTWRVRYWFPPGSKQSVERSYLLGVYPAIGAGDAIRQCVGVKDQVRAGTDPNIDKKLKQAQEIAAMGVTFRQIGEDYIEYSSGHLAPLTIARNNGILNAKVYPEIGDLPADKIDTPLVVALCRKIERDSSENAHRSLGMITQIYQHAAHSGLVKQNVGALAKGCLRPLVKGHFPAIFDEIRLGEFLVAIADWRGSVTVETAVRVTPHLLQRPFDIRHMRWRDITLDAAEPLWTFIVRKSGDRHRVPLTDFVVQQLKRLREITGDRHEFCFIGQRTNRPFTDVVVSAVFREVGFAGEITPHSCRAVGRTLMEETLRISPYTLERILAHSTASIDNMRGAYMRSDMLEARREAMVAWSAFIEQLERDARSRLAGQNVVDFARGGRTEQKQI